MKKWLITIVGLCISAIAIALILAHTEWRQTANLVLGAGIKLPAVLVVIYLCTFPIRAQRWQWMLPAGTLSFSQALSGVVLGFAGNNFLPARGGEFLRMEYLYRKAPHIGRVTALSSIMVERMLDGLTLLAILVASLSASHIAMADHPWLGNLRLVALLIFGLASAGSIVLRIWGQAIAELIRRPNTKLLNWAAALIERFHVAAAFMGLNRHTAGAVIAGFCVWLVEGAMYVVACRHFGLGSQSIVAGYLTLAIANFGLLVPSSPGSVGVFQGIVILALRLFGVTDDAALALSIVVHACQYVPTTAWGVAILCRESYGYSRRVDARHDTVSPPAAPIGEHIATTFHEGDDGNPTSTTRVYDEHKSQLQ